MDGSTASSYLVTSPGTYSVTVTNQNGCHSVDLFTISEYNLSLAFGMDTVMCEGEPLLLQTGHPEFTTQWSTGATTPSILITNAGLYSVTVNHACGQISGETQVTAVPAPVVDLGADTVYIPQDGNVILDAGNQGVIYLWSNGATTQTLNVTASGTYTVTVTDGNNCHATDKVVVIVKLGLEENTSTGTISIYPNPANDKLFIRCMSNPLNRIELYNSVGQLILQTRVPSDIYEINTSHLGDGIYFIWMYGESQIPQIHRVAILR
jgi:hypothetical protein